MGMFFEYFRAVNDETAKAAHALRTGVLRCDPPFDAVDATGVFYDPGINRLPDRTRDVLAACSEGDVPRVAARWRHDLGFLSQDEAEQRVRDLAALARRAQQAGEGFYCWSAM